MKLRKCLRLSQHNLKRAARSELKRAGYRPVTAPGFLYAKGTTPVLLVAHLDTVHRKLPSAINDNHGVLSSPEGIGGDDRAGIYAIFQMLDLRPHILLCEDEETGGVGAGLFAASSIRPDVGYIIELDRMGANDAVFYGCANDPFARFVESYGFIEDFGSFSDISVIAPALGIAAANVSVGYYHQHTAHELIDTHILAYTVSRVRRMLKDATDERRDFEYIEDPTRFHWGYPAAYRDPSGADGYGAFEELEAGRACPCCCSDALEPFAHFGTGYLSCPTCGWEYAPCPGAVKGYTP
jgi:hypothetical protein